MKERGIGRMDGCRTCSMAIVLGVILLGCVHATPARAEIFYDVGIKGVYEDNIVGLLTDKGRANGTGAGPGSMSKSTSVVGAMGAGRGPGSGSHTLYTGTTTEQNSDLSIDAFAELGVSIAAGTNTRFFLSGSGERISYNSFTEFNMTAGGASTGITHRFGDRILARVAATGLVKRFEDADRDSSAWRLNILLKEAITERFWLRQGLAFERNRAESAFFTYTGNSVSVWAGYAVAERTTLLAGYNYIVREYDEPSGFEETANTVSLALEWKLFRKWFLDLQYDRRATDSTLPDTYSTGNIYSIGIRYSY